MDLTSLPELSKPFRAQKFKEKTEKLKFQNFEKIRKILKACGLMPPAPKMLRKPVKYIVRIVRKRSIAKLSIATESTAKHIKAKYSGAEQAKAKQSRA